MFQLPPPLPPRKPRGTLHWIIPVAIGTFCLILVAAGLISLGFYYALSASEIELSETQKACLVTVEDVSVNYEIEILDGATTLTAERYRDGSVRVDYLYDDPYEEAVQLQCVLMTEVDVSSANLAYNIEWAALKAANQFVNTDIELRTENSKFQWGDRSTFAIQESEGEGNGFAFVSRKGRRVFFIDCWGLPIEDSAELSDILLPHLEKFALEQF